MHPIEKMAYLSLRLPDIPIEKMIQHIFATIPNVGERDGDITVHTIMKVIRSMDTEYDRQCAKVLLVASNYNKAELYSCGVNPHTAKKHIDRIQTIVDECENAQKLQKILFFCD